MAKQGRKLGLLPNVYGFQEDNFLRFELYVLHESSYNLSDLAKIGSPHCRSRVNRLLSIRAGGLLERPTFLAPAAASPVNACDRAPSNSSGGLDS